MEVIFYELEPFTKIVEKTGWVVYEYDIKPDIMPDSEGNPVSVVTYSFTAYTLNTDTLFIFKERDYVELHRYYRTLFDQKIDRNLKELKKKTPIVSYGQIKTRED